MNTPYQWTKQVASHFGGTRDGLVVHWPSGIKARGEVRHQFHHVIDVLPTVLDAAGLPVPETVQGVPQQRVEGTSMRYSFDDPDAEETRRTQYFEMVGNRGIYHEGWTAVTRHGVPVADGRGAAPLRRRQVGALRHPRRLVAGPRPRGRRPRTAAPGCRRSSTRRPRSTRSSLSTTASPSGRTPSSPGGTTCTTAAPGWCSARAHGRLSEEAAPNVKNRSHRITVDLDIPADHPPQSTKGVLVAQGGRFGGWSLYVVEGRPHYAYNRYGKDLTVVRGRLGAVAGRARGRPRLPLRRRAARQRWRGPHPPRRGRGRRGPDRGDHGVLLRLRRVLQHRHRPRQPRSSTTTPRCATGSPARSAGCVDRPRPGHRTRRRDPARLLRPQAPTTDASAGRHLRRRPPRRSHPAPGTVRRPPAAAAPRCSAPRAACRCGRAPGPRRPRPIGSNSPWQVA